MTTYEKLEAKKQLCVEAARRCLCNGAADMAAVWYNKAKQIDGYTRSLSIKELEKEVIK